MELIELQVVSVIAFAVIVLGMFAFDMSRLGVILLVLCTILLSTTNGWEGSKDYTRTYTHIKTLVSASPSHTQIDGKISGSFLMFSGVIGESRVYLLREEVSKGLYKDFEVKHEVYIREDGSLTNDGKFVQYFNCYDISTYYDIYGWIVFDNKEESCYYQKQEIVVPVGSVIKELNI